MSRKKWFWILVISLNLIPLAASGAPKDKPPAPSQADLQKKIDDLQSKVDAMAAKSTTASTSGTGTAVTTSTAAPATAGSTVYQKSMSLSDANDAFFNFHAEKTGNDPSSSLTLRGFVFASCNPGSLKIQHLKATDGSKIGFEIEDPSGAVRKCMADMKSKNQNCETSKCVSLSTLDNGKIDLSKEVDQKLKKTVALQLCTIDPNVDSDTGKTANCNDFGSTTLTYTPDGAQAAAQAQADADARSTQIERYNSQISSCMDSLAHLPIARQAVARLQRLGEITAAQADADRKKIDAKEFTLLAAKVKKAKPEEYDDLRSQLTGWAAAHPGNDSKVAELLHQIALGYVHQKNAGQQGWDDAQAAIADAQGLDGLNSTDTARLEDYQRDISVGRTQSACAGGMSSPQCQPSYLSLMQSLQGEAQTACSGSNASLEECSNAMASMQSAATIPQQARQADMQNCQRQMQLRQMMGMQSNPMQCQMMSGGNVGTGVQMPGMQMPGMQMPGMQMPGMSTYGMQAPYAMAGNPYASLSMPGYGAYGGMQSMALNPWTPSPYTSPMQTGFFH
jgi:hypothetical protein